MMLFLILREHYFYPFLELKLGSSILEKSARSLALETFHDYRNFFAFLPIFQQL